MDSNTILFYIVVIGLVLGGFEIKYGGLLKYLRRHQPENKELTDGERERKLLNK